MMLSNPVQRKRIVSIVLVIGMGCLIYFGLLALSRQDKISVRFNTLPENAKITINDGDQLKGGSTAYLSPGTYEVTLTAEGFQTSKDKIVVGDQDITKYYILSSGSSQADEWQQKNQQKILEFEGKRAEQASEASEEFRKKNTVTSILPYRNVLYSIEYRAGENGVVIVQIIADSAENRSFALQKLREFGYEPTDLKIEFPGNFINAFVQEEVDESELN